MKAFLSRWLSKANPHPDSWRGMATAFHVAAWILLALITTAIFWQAPSGYNLLTLLMMVLLVVVAVGVVYYGIALLARMFPAMRWSLALLLLVATLPFGFLGPAFFVLLAVLVLALAMVGASVANHRRRGLRHWATLGPGLLGGSGLMVLVVGGSLSGWQTEENIAWQPMLSGQLALSDPSLPGAHAVEQFTYGPATDTRRTSYGRNVRFETATVDGSKLLDGWKGGAGWARSGYWNDASPETLPLRGVVWMPQGKGPFPLVLIVHGNHQMEDFSDDGYGYLGELFASRGIITVSVDENFLNSSTSSLLSLFDGGLEEENDARGWVLLEHLRQWRAWSTDTSHELFAKADLERVVLIGHSRGGEAVSEAAVFNRLPAYPDDATLKFDYDFGLQGIVAIAPVDHQYHPRDRDTKMNDVNYLVIHGSHDSDVNSYAGYAAFSRASFANCGTCFKAGIYLLGANHGQFNTGWGRYDAPAPFSWFLNVAPLMPGERQRQIAKVIFSAFLEVVLFDNMAYRPFIAGPHRSADLLPDDTRLLSQYQAASDLVLANFEEDASVATSSLLDLRLEAVGLKLWRETEVALKWRTTSSAMVLLGWDTSDDEVSPSYRLHGLSNLHMSLSPEHALTLSLGMSSEKPGEIEEYEAPEAIDLTIEAVDQAGQVSRVPLSARRVLLPQVKPVLYKHPGLDSDPPSEVVMQRYRFSLSEFTAANPQLDIHTIESVGLVFDLTKQGSVWLDDLAISTSGE